MTKEEIQRRIDDYKNQLEKANSPYSFMPYGAVYKSSMFDDLVFIMEQLEQAQAEVKHWKKAYHDMSYLNQNLTYENNSFRQALEEISTRRSVNTREIARKALEGTDNV